MAAADSSIPRVFHGASAIVISDGSNSVTIIFEGTFTWSATGRTKNEARSRGRHKSTPVVTEGEDGDISISMSGKITSYLGSSNTHLYEALTKTGNAAGWTPTADGNAHTYRIVYTSLNGAAAGGTQTLTFAYCSTDSIDIDTNGDGGHETLEASITDRENLPTPA